MRKKFLSYIAIFSLIMGLFVMGQTNTIYADNTKLNPDDMESILNDISSVGKAWESMEFQSQEISEIDVVPANAPNSPVTHVSIYCLPTSSYFRCIRQFIY